MTRDEFNQELKVMDDEDVRDILFEVSDLTYSAAVKIPTENLRTHAGDLFSDEQLATLTSEDVRGGFYI